MTAETVGFRPILIRLWLRLMTIGALALLVASAPEFPQLIDPWLYYERTGVIVFGTVVRVIFVALVGMALGTICTAVVAPFLLRYASSRERIADVATKVAVALAAFLNVSIAAKILIRPTIRWAGFKWFPATILTAIAFAVALCIPRRRKQIVTSLDGFLGERTTRRTVIVASVASAGLVVAERVMGSAAFTSTVRASTSRPAGPNILLVTFDALSAEDMSLYGYRLPTTPYIDQFARKGTVFNNFYSASTFTTPCIASLLTGMYPSQNRIYHLEARIPADARWKTLPRVLRAAGYATGASTSNPYAYFLQEGLAADFDVLPDPPYRTAGLDLWKATEFLHQREPYSNRANEFGDLEAIRDYLPVHMGKRLPGIFGRTTSGFAPQASFAQAREVLDKLPDGFFLWVHVLAPHGPYLPDAPWLGRFLPTGEMRNAADQNSFASWPHYAPETQYLVDKVRLRYDEFLAQADEAFGTFMSGVEASGRLRNTAVIVSADHGESFEGGVMGHYNEWQNRPGIHIPLVIRMPGQQEGRRVETAIDQTSLTPTILDIAGLPKPDWMTSRSLLPLDMNPPDAKPGLAFSQYLATDSLFKPLHRGTVGVIDGQNQYVHYLATGKGMLRSLREAQIWDRDRSAENPALVQTMREAIYSRFPDLPRTKA